MNEPPTPPIRPNAHKATRIAMILTYALSTISRHRCHTLKRTPWRAEMIELTAKEREIVIQILRKHPGVGSDVDVKGFLKEKPLSSHFFAMAARGQMKDGRVATDGYLRSLPDDLLERLALALREYKIDTEGREADKRSSDLLLVLTLVVSHEKQD